ncbi:MAG: TPM domain-containing protein [Niabella sp.]
MVFFTTAYLLLSGIVTFSQSLSELPEAPNPPRLVNDFTIGSGSGFITSQEIQALERKLVAYDDTTSNQIAIVIVNNLRGYNIEDYAVALGRKWGIGGQKQFSNGVLILVNTGEQGDKRGVFIATGYGMEGVVPDIVAGEIVQNDLLPNFRAGNNYEGLNLAVDDIIAAAAGRYKAPEGYADRGDGGNISLFTIILIIVVVFIVLAIISKGNNGGGGYVSRRGYTDDWGRGGTPWIFSGGSGSGGWSSGGGGFGGSSGGGFGGFGGGSFGGGGAGGSW